jgi:hypothetical protein
MVGFPKHLNSKDDYLYVKDNFPAEQWKPAFQELLNDRLQWFNTGTIATGQIGVTDSTHKIVTVEAMGDMPAANYQYELKEDPNCDLLRLGFTVAEVQAILA